MYHQAGMGSTAAGVKMIRMRESGNAEPEPSAVKFFDLVGHKPGRPPIAGWRRHAGAAGTADCDSPAQQPVVDPMRRQPGQTLKRRRGEIASRAERLSPEAQGFADCRPRAKFRFG